MDHPLDYIKLKARRVRDLGKDERWLQQAIVDDPKILGLGDTVEVLSKERRQPSGGRLDILLGNENDDRFELEVQLGATDEKHIVRTIEYWDVERKRYPNWNHVAVIAAEEVIERFFNVVHLFGSHIPLIALQIAAFDLADKGIGLHFFKVLDTRKASASQADEEQSAPTDEVYWITKSNQKYVNLTRQIIAEISAEKWSPNYNRYYIGIEKSGLTVAKFHVRPKKNWLHLYFSIAEKTEVTNYITEKISDPKIYDGYIYGSAYRFRLSSNEDWKNNESLFKSLFAYVIKDESLPAQNLTSDSSEK